MTPTSGRRRASERRGRGRGEIARLCRRTPWFRLVATPDRVPVLLLALAGGCGGGGVRAVVPTPEPVVEALAPVVDLRDAAARTVTLRVAFAAGSSEDPSPGALHVAAHLAAEGGTASLSATELTRALYPMAGSIDVRVDRDQTVFLGRVHRDRIDAFYPLFRDVLLRPRMGAEDFARIREQARAALTLGLRGGNDEELGKEVLQGMLYEGHPFGHPSLGTETGLAALTLEDAKRTRALLLCLGRASPGIAGGAPDALVDQLARDLGELPRCGVPRASLPAVPGSDGRRVVIVDKPEATATALSIGVPVSVVPGDPDHPALALAFAWLGQHRQFAGRLFQLLREERGLNYGDYAYSEHFQQDAWSRFPLPNTARRQQYCSVWIRPVSPANAHFALRAAVREIERLVAEGIPAADFEPIRTFVRRYYQLYVQTESRRLGFALDARFYGMRLSPVEELRESWARLTPAEVKAALRRHVDPRRLSVAIVAPRAGELADAIAGDEPSPITYDSPKSDALMAEDRQIAATRLGIARERIRVVPVDEVFR